jgi:hypothetical protein
MVVNELVQSVPLTEEKKSQKSESSEGSEQPKEKWIVDRTQAKSTNVKDWQNSLNKMDVHGAKRVYLTLH